MEGAQRATASLGDLADRPEGKHLHAACGLREGSMDTMTVLRLGILDLLRWALSTTNATRCALNRTRTPTRNMNNWQSGAMALRWVSTG